MFYLLIQSIKLNLYLRDTQISVLGITWESRKNLSIGNLLFASFSFFRFRKEDPRFEYK